jgi:hypothetical protein
LFLVRIKNWCVTNVEVETAGAKLSGALMILCLAFILLVIPLLFWVVGASDAGKRQFRKEVCDTRSAKVLPSQLVLNHGTTISGRFIERSEKISAVMDRDAVHVVLLGENPVVQDSTSVLTISCPQGAQN